MAELEKSASRFKKKNATLAVIGPGEPENLESYRQATGFTGKLLADPSRTAFDQLGFSKGITGLMSLKTIFKGLSALKEGHKQGPIQGNALQLGGAVVVDPSPAITYFFASQKAGDHPAVEELLAAVTG